MIIMNWKFWKRKSIRERMKEWHEHMNEIAVKVIQDLSEQGLNSNEMSQVIFHAYQINILLTIAFTTKILESSSKRLEFLTVVLAVLTLTLILKECGLW